MGDKKQSLINLLSHRIDIKNIDPGGFMDNLTLHINKDNSRIITQEALFQSLFGQSVESFIQEIKTDSTRYPELSKKVIA